MRCNQLQFKMFEDAVRGSKGFSDILQTSWTEKRIEEYQDGRTIVLDWAKESGWNHDGHPPSRSNWAKAIPSFTQLTRELVESAGEPAVVGQILYSTLSGVVHSNPILVGTALDELPQAARLYSAALRCKAALGFYYLLMDRISRWTGWISNTDGFHTAERVCQELFLLYLDETPHLFDSPEELREYLQHIHNVVIWSASADTP